MIKIDDIVGDIVFISFNDSDRYKDVGINEPSGHFKIKGYDHIGIWLEHPGIIFTKTENEKGKPIPPAHQIREEIDAIFLVQWDNIKTLMHYPNRDGFDFPSEFLMDIGFKIEEDKSGE